MCITDMLACVYTYHVILVNVLDCIHVCEVYNIILLMYYDVIQCIYIYITRYITSNVYYRFDHFDVKM
jgi:hypothetical protein